MTLLSDAIEATLRVTSVLEGLGVRYVVGGSLASSLQGIPRATQDVDVVAAMREEHVEPFASLLGHDFYVDRDMIRDAIRTRHEFNVIYQPTVFKIDVFVPVLDLVTRRELSRGVRYALDEARSLVVASPEDVIVQKLRWYRLGNHISERQWTDALGVIETHRARLDRGYLAETAELLGVSDLLEQVLAEGGAA